MLSHIKSELKELTLGSTAYGVPNIARSKHTINKILWLIFILLSSTFSCFYVYMGIVGYFDYAVFTNVQIEYDQPADFPTVSFCSGSVPFDENTLTSLESKDNRFGYDYSISTEPSKHFESYYTVDRGLCFRFNSGKNMSNHSIPIKKSTIGGRDDSFALKIDSKYALFVWVHNHSSPPRMLDKNNHDSPITVASGTKAYIAIDKTVDHKLGEPYNQCLKDVESFDGKNIIIDYLLHRKESYSQVKCFELCFDFHYMKYNPCDCSSDLGNIWFECWTIKENKNKTGCTFLYKKQFYEKRLKSMCADFCPLECDSISFLITSSSFVFDNYTTIQVFYRSLKYTLITQQPRMLPFDLISSLGGTLGLFIGLSFVSLFEIAEIFIEVVGFIFWHKKLNQTKPNDTIIISNLGMEISENKRQIKDLKKLLNDSIKSIQL